MRNSNGGHGTARRFLLLRHRPTFPCLQSTNTSGTARHNLLLRHFPSFPCQQSKNTSGTARHHLLLRCCPPFPCLHSRKTSKLIDMRVSRRLLILHCPPPPPPPPLPPSPAMPAFSDPNVPALPLAFSLSLDSYLCLLLFLALSPLISGKKFDPLGKFPPINLKPHFPILQTHPKSKKTQMIQSFLKGMTDLWPDISGSLRRSCIGEL